MRTPETSNLVPMTYAEATQLYHTVRRPFSFLAAPYGVLKTVVVQRGTIVAAPPQSYCRACSAGLNERAYHDCGRGAR